MGEFTDIENEELRARVKELEADLLSVHDALHRECDGKANLPFEIRNLRDERDALRAQLDEAVAALRALVSAESSHLARGEDTTPGDFERAWKTACAVLAKHQEVSRG